MLSSMLILALIAGSGGLLAGVLAGLFGVGGGALIVPCLSLLGATLHQASSLSLVYIFFTSLSGVVTYWRQKQIDIPLSLAVSGGAAVSGLFGVQFAMSLPESLLAWLFVGFMIVILSSLFFKNRSQTNKPDLSKQPPTAFKKIIFSILIGLLAGLLSTVLGVGGGIAIVPMLVLLCGLELKQATATSLASICLISITGTAEHMFMGELLPYLQQFGLAIFLMSLAGMFASPWGVKLNQKWPESRIRLGFVILCLLVIGFMLNKAIS